MLHVASELAGSCGYVNEHSGFMNGGNNHHVDIFLWQETKVYKDGAVSNSTVFMSSYMIIRQCIQMF
jgi:hypothetical protein